jgi:hypothetical protein
VSKFFLDMLGLFAEFETNLRRERQFEGTAGTRRFWLRRASCDIPCDGSRSQ